MAISPRPSSRRLAFWPTAGLLLAAAFLAGCKAPPPSAEVAAGDRYLFCFWNAENFFDDVPDQRLREPDKEFDDWFAKDPAILALKLKRLREALLQMNDGKGPDILALAEVESERAARLLLEQLNRHLPAGAAPYEHVLFKDVKGGRSINTAVVTRLKVHKNRTQVLGSRLRILETHIEANGHDLVVIASHWSSRLSDKTGETRGKYANQIYGRYKAMYLANKEVDFLVCGDFNDPPDAPSVTKHLRAVKDPAELTTGGDEPRLLNLSARLDPERAGTIYHDGKWAIFDQIVVSPGMLDAKGWSCDPNGLATFNKLTRPDDKKHRPWRFGGPKTQGERGYSDHFPVTLPLGVAKG